LLNRLALPYRQAMPRSDPMPSYDDDAGKPSWRQRARPVGYELYYVIEGPELVIDSTRKIDRVKLGAVEQVRFTFDPGNISSRGYKVQLRLTDGKTITFGDLSWVSMINIERNPPRYRRFVTALCAAIAKANPSCRFIAGMPRPKWFAMVLVAVVATLGMAGFAVSAWQRGQNNAALVSLFFTLAGLWQIIPIIRNNQPRSLATGEVPDWLMP
jgi:hypothetical protein